MLHEHPWGIEVEAGIHSHIRLPAPGGVATLLKIANQLYLPRRALGFLGHGKGQLAGVSSACSITNRNKQMQQSSRWVGEVRS